MNLRTMTARTWRIPTLTTARVTELVRGHWDVENSLHRVLDNTPGRTAAACARAMPPATGPPCGASP